MAGWEAGGELEEKCTLSIAIRHPTCHLCALGAAVFPAASCVPAEMYAKQGAA